MSLLLQLCTTGLILGVLYGLFAYGLSLIVATTGIFHFAHGLALVGAAYAFWWSFEDAGLPWWAAGVGACAAGALLGLLVYAVIYRPLLRRSADHTVVLVASLTAMTLGQGLLTLLFGTDAKALPPSGFSDWRTDVGVVTIRAWDILVVVAAAVVLVGLHHLQNRTKTGLALRAVGDNPALAQMLGFNLHRTYVLAFAVGSITAAIPGVLLAVQTPVTAHLGFSLLLKAIVAVIIGGVGNLTGALYGGLLIGLSESLSSYILPTEWTEFVVFALLFGFIALRPTGIRASAVRLA